MRNDFALLIFRARI